MSAIYYGNLEEAISTEQDWIDDEEFEELNIDLKQFDIKIDFKNKDLIQRATKVFMSFFERNDPITNLQSIGVITNKFLNGHIFKVTDDVIWFKMSSLERVPSRSFTSILIKKLTGELFPKLLNNTQSIYLLNQQTSYDDKFEYYTNQQTDDLKYYRKEFPIIVSRASEGLFFEYCIKNQKKIHIFKLPIMIDEVLDLKEFLPIQLYDHIKIKSNYLIAPSNLYA